MINSSRAPLSKDDTYHYQGLESIKKGLSIIGESPVIKCRLQGAHYSKQKVSKIKSTFMKSMLMPEVGDDDSEMIKQLMEKLHEIEEKSQILILRTFDELEHQKD